jgi:tetratricopeptide (TPR) repeat protein
MSVLQARLATIYADLGSGHLQEAGQQVDELMQAHADLPEVRRAQAAWLQLSGRADEAIDAMRSAVALAPDDAGLHVALGQVQASAGRIEDAIVSFRMACDRQPGSADAWYALGATLYGSDRHAEALPALDRAHALVPAQAVVTTVLADALFLLGRCEEALVHFEGLARELPPDPMRTLRIAQCHRGLGDPVRALQAAKTGPTDAFAPLWLEIGGLHEDLGDAEAAHAAYAHAHALQPDWAEPVSALIGLRREATADVVLDAAHALLGQPDLPARSRALLHHALGKRADRLGACDEAAAHWREANRLRRAGDGALDRAAYRARIDTLIARTADGVRASPGDAAMSSPRALFVVGMPRSGTTLVEQILAAHPMAHGCGELTVFTAFGTTLPDAPFTQDDGTLADLAARWHAAVRRTAPDAGAQDGVALAIDKHPLNLEQLALIAAALPDARVVWCRRDPRDVALSIYTESFAPEATYATDLDDIRFLMTEQARLMRHWREVLPLPIHDIRYEHLVDEPEAQARRLLDFAGLPWHDDCLRFHANTRPVQTLSRWQVRQPIHRGAIGRWRRYADWFEGWPDDRAEGGVDGGADEA